MCAPRAPRLCRAAREKVELARAPLRHVPPALNLRLYLATFFSAPAPPSYAAARAARGLFRVPLPPRSPNSGVNFSVPTPRDKRGGGGAPTGLCDQRAAPLRRERPGRLKRRARRVRIAPESPRARPRRVIFPSEVAKSGDCQDS